MRLRQVREKQSLSQRELGRRCNIGVNQINRYENGVSEPTIPILSVIAQALGVSVDYLIGLTDQTQGFHVPTEVKPDEQEVLDVYRNEGWVGLIRIGAEKISK